MQKRLPQQFSTVSSSIEFCRVIGPRTPNRNFLTSQCVAAQRPKSGYASATIGVLRGLPGATGMLGRHGSSRFHRGLLAVFLLLLGISTGAPPAQAQPQLAGPPSRPEIVQAAPSNGEVALAGAHDGTQFGGRTAVTVETATGSSYVPVEAHAGKRPKAEVSFIDGDATVLTGNATAPVTILAAREKIGAGIEDLVLTLLRGGDAADVQETTVEIAQDEDWLDEADLTHTVSFPAGSDTATLTIPAHRFSLDPDTTGSLTATVTGSSGKGSLVAVEMVSIADPPITVGYEKSGYTFAEDADPADVAVYAVAALDPAYPWAPSLTFSLGLEAHSGTAVAIGQNGDGDFLPVVSETAFKTDDYEFEDGRFVARKRLQDRGGAFYLLNDEVYEGDEQLEVSLSPGLFTPGLLRFRSADGTFCIGFCVGIRYPVTITDEEDLPALSLAADPASIFEKDEGGTQDAENVSVLTMAITNAKTFAADRTLTLAFAGTAEYGTDYTVAPADADTNAAGHQVVLQADASSVEVSLTARDNDLLDGDRTVTLAGAHDGTQFGGRIAVTIADDDAEALAPVTIPAAFLLLSGVMANALPAQAQSATVPSAPQNLTATPGNGTATLAWQAPADNGGSEIIRYDISYLQLGFPRVDVIGDDSLTATVDGLTNGTEYAFEVRARNASGAGDAAEITATPATVPSAPQNLAATPGDAEVTLAWQAPGDNGGLAVIGFQYRYAEGASVPEETAWTSAGTNLTVTVGSLANGIAHSFEVRAVNAKGDGPAARVQATPEADRAGTNTDPTVANAIPDQRATTGTAFRYAFPADTFNDADGDTLTYTATNRNGSALPAWLRFTPSTRTFSGTPQFADLGRVTVKVTVSDGRGGSASDEFVIRVLSGTLGPLELSVEMVDEEVTEGEPVRYRIGMSKPTGWVSVGMRYAYQGQFMYSTLSSSLADIRSRDGRLYWEVEQATVDDSRDEPDGTFTVELQPGDGYWLGSPSSATVRILDNDVPTLTHAAVAVDDARVEEGPGAVLEFPVTLDRALGTTVTVDWRTLDGSARAGEDYEAGSGTLTFHPGETAKTVGVTVLDDSHDEGREFLLLVLSNPSGADMDGEGTIALGIIENTDPMSDIEGIEIVSAPRVAPESASGTGAYGPGETVAFAVRFATAVTLDTPGDDGDAAPTLRLDVGGAEHLARYAAGTGTGTLRFEWTVPATLEASATSIAVTSNKGEAAGGLTLEGSTLTDAGGRPILIAHSQVTFDDVLRVASPALDAGGEGASVEGAAMRLRYVARAGSEEPALFDAGSMPAPGDFAAAAGGEAVAVASVAVGAEPGVVALALAAPVEAGQAVTLGYTPGTAPIVDLWGNRAAGFADREVDNATEATVERAQQAPSEDTIAAYLATGVDEHDGRNIVRVDVTFSEPVAIERAEVRSGRIFDIRHGHVVEAVTVGVEADSGWRVYIAPGATAQTPLPSWEAIEVALALPPGDCTAARAVCIADGRTFEAPGPTLRIEAPAAVSVADAAAHEAPGATLDFEVTLSRASNRTIAVEYATSDGTARAGEDYRRTEGTLELAPGTTRAMVSVPVLDDAVDEGEETMRLRLVEAGDTRFARRRATGTIANTDAMPQAWLARFGRTVAEQVLDAVEERIRSAPRAGAQVTLAGRRIGAATPPSEEEARDADAEARPESLSAWLRGEADKRRTRLPAVALRELLAGSSFALTTRADGIGGGLVSLWGRGAVSRFDGREGGLSLSGEVVGALFGADWTRDPGSGSGAGGWTAGLMMSHARGAGRYREADDGGEVSSTITGLYPYGRYAVNDRMTVWGAAGYGAGSLVLKPEGRKPIETGMDLAMAAAGLHGTVVEAPADGGPELAVKTDAMAVRTSSEAVSGGAGGSLAAATADVTRLRLGLEGTWRGLKIGTGRLAPQLEVGVRHDGGDAETGLGLDLGVGLAWSDPATGIQAELRGRGLLTHENPDFRERGFSGALRWNPDPDSSLGPSLTLRQTVGNPASGGMDALLGRDTMAGLAANGDGPPKRRLEVTLGYGIGVFGGRFTATPELGLGLSDTRDYSLGWRLGLARRHERISLDLKIEATRRESPDNDREPEHWAGLRLRLAW